MAHFIHPIISLETTVRMETTVSTTARINHSQDGKHCQNRDPCTDGDEHGPEIDGSIKHTVICDLFWENVPKCVNNFFLIYL